MSARRNDGFRQVKSEGPQPFRRLSVTLARADACLILLFVWIGFVSMVVAMLPDLKLF